jgi:hypothetical protein
MIAVTYKDAAIEIHAFHNLSGSGNGVHRSGAFWFRNDSLRGNAAIHEISAADVGFGKYWVAAGAAGGHDQWRQMDFVQVEGMIQASA